MDSYSDVSATYGDIHIHLYTPLNHYGLVIRPTIQLDIKIETTDNSILTSMIYIHERKILRTVMIHGGYWDRTSEAVSYRGMNNLLFTLGLSVASSSMKNSHSYTDWHTVDEDLRTISNQGGWWIDNDLTGVEDRDLYHSHTSAFDTVASKK